MNWKIIGATGEWAKALIEMPDPCQLPDND